MVMLPPKWVPDSLARMHPNVGADCRLSRVRESMRSGLSSAPPPTPRKKTMTIKVGDRIPNTTLNYLKDGVQAINTDEIFKGKKVVLFSVPGAFTPTCSAKHLPGYVERFDEFKKKGVEVAC